MVRYVNGPTPGSPADLQEDADPEQVARTILLRRLSAAPRTRAELRTDLLRRGIPETIADRVLDRFVDVGLVDDAEYARMWVESRQRSRGSARGVLRQELRTKGIDDEAARAALAQIDDDAERIRGIELARRKVATMSRLDDTARRRRLVSMLVRRGYRQAQAVDIVVQVLAEAGLDDPDSDALLHADDDGGAQQR